MKKNLGTTDRMIRIVLALLLGGLYFTGTVMGTAGIVILALAGVFLLTAFMSFCPIYFTFGFSTKKKDQ